MDLPAWKPSWTASRMLLALTQSPIFKIGDPEDWNI
jgi:hypothetical protein